MLLTNNLLLERTLLVLLKIKKVTYLKNQKAIELQQVTSTNNQDSNSDQREIEDRKSRTKIKFNNFLSFLKKIMTDQPTNAQTHLSNE